MEENVLFLLYTFSLAKYCSQIRLARMSFENVEVLKNVFKYKI